MTIKFPFAVLVAAAIAIAAVAQTPTNSVPAKATPAVSKPKPPVSEGQRLFSQHCSRCHTAPDGFSPSISGTVVRHMRVRASLSQRDEQELLHFFNP